MFLGMPDPGDEDPEWHQSSGLLKSCEKVISKNIYVNKKGGFSSQLYLLFFLDAHRVLDDGKPVRVAQQEPLEVAAVPEDQPPHVRLSQVLPEQRVVQPQRAVRLERKYAAKWYTTISKHFEKNIPYLFD